MAIDALVAPLLRVRLFQGLQPLQLSEIARRCERVMFRAGDVITEAGVEADAAILIVAGPTERSLDGTLSGACEAIEPGSLVGEMAMLIDHVYGSTVVARGPVKALRITRAGMLEQMEADRSLAEHLVAQISGRLTSVAAELRRVDEAIAGPHVSGSIAQALAGMPPPIAVPQREFPSVAAH
jgi:CRP-like cAMP-binding protein